MLLVEELADRAREPRLATAHLAVHDDVARVVAASDAGHELERLLDGPVTTRRSSASATSAHDTSSSSVATMPPCAMPGAP
jgi:hypothetical protein